MSYQQKPNNGSLFRNARKEKDTHPDHTGTCNIGGKDYWISAWIKNGKDGKFFSLAFKPKEAQAVSAKRESAPKDDGAFQDDEEISF